MRTKIYTKGGDRGETGILGGVRLSKSDARLCAYGAIDELNATIGMAAAILPSTLPQLKDFLTQTQNHLFVIGGQLACADENMRPRLPQHDPNVTEKIEREIDSLTDELPELREFILPGGAAPAAALHFCRTVCRRSERELVRFFAETDGPSPTGAEPFPKILHDPFIAYLNRLGDYLFVAARFANHSLQIKETTWQK